jgi:hypothetical protein
MPEVTVTVRWPDGRVEEHYAPSTTSASAPSPETREPR